MKLTLDELVALTGGKIIRDLNNGKLAGMASLNEAGADEVSFLGNKKYYQDYLNTEAGVVLLPPNVSGEPKNASLIEVENPTLAFGAVVKHFVTVVSGFKPGVHPSAILADDVEFDPAEVCIKAGAIIESGVKIGNGSEIGAGVVVGESVTIGNNCQLHANCTVRERCILEDRVILQPGCVIGSDGYGYEVVDGRHEKIDQVGIVVLEQDVEIGSNSTVDRARFGKTIIGEGSKIDNQVQIGHNVRMGKHCLIVSQVGIAGSTIIGDYVTMAGQSGTAGHLKIGDKATFTARTGAIKDLEGGVVYMGMPARPMREELKKQANLSRLPKLMAEVKALRQKLDELEK